MSHNWQNILVSPSATIEEVLGVIDREALKLAMVVDDQNHLLGTVTDGDIRRALINNKPLTTAVENIMFKSPTTVAADTPREQIRKLMDEKELYSIPLIFDDQVVGLETYHNTRQKNKYDNPVFLMAGGFGSRLKPLTDGCPKPLLKVGERPILEILLLNFIRSGFHNFYISTHYLPNMIRDYFGEGEKWGVTINYVHEDEPLGTGGALGLLPRDLPDMPIIVMNGDVLTKVNIERLLDFHNKQQANATMCVREYEYQVPFGVIESEGHYIKSMVEKPIQRFHVNAGIYVIGREIVKSVTPNQYIDMPTLLEMHLQNNVIIYPFYDYWIDIGRIEDYNRAQVDIKTLDI